MNCSTCQASLTGEAIAEDWKKTDHKRDDAIIDITEQLKNEAGCLPNVNPRALTLYSDWRKTTC